MNKSNINEVAAAQFAMQLNNFVLLLTVSRAFGLFSGQATANFSPCDGDSKPGNL